MLFGKTEAEQLKAYQARRAKIEALKNVWDFWFAWYPVILTHGKKAGKVVWLSFVYRTPDILRYDYDKITWITWYYKTLKD
jgi:hypothetical protein